MRFCLGLLLAGGLAVGGCGSSPADDARAQQAVKVFAAVCLQDIGARSWPMVDRPLTELGFTETWSIHETGRKLREPVIGIELVETPTDRHGMSDCYISVLGADADAVTRITGKYLASRYGAGAWRLSVTEGNETIRKQALFTTETQPFGLNISVSPLGQRLIMIAQKWQR
ncbi:MAG: hypothetical protein Q4G22_08220 [Paracoccus sp. (in: a-proteobacteria)]|uniref:hypothetical protein n=1 Tax=Paracoccus sp. TaxID=267 RepID=UPI0026DEE0C9|nr:hypothetical protein [Paracoccus sp. (in: a-proteobacteria)]MDO5631809.1 hypothetical protein [Paracoccus sp. (in: a-proteobacteria)]